MKNISLHNYQDFLLRYIDGELDLRETEALLAFVALRYLKIAFLKIKMLKHLHFRLLKIIQQ